MIEVYRERLKKSGKPIKTCSCGTHLTTANSKHIGDQEVEELGGEYKGKVMSLYNCPKCDTTVSHLHDKLNKSEDLQKAVVTSIKPEDMPEVGSNTKENSWMGKANHIASHRIADKYHHVFEYQNDPTVFHFLSHSADPHKTSQYIAEINTLPIGKSELSNKEKNHLKGWHDPHQVSYARAKKLGMGHGKQLYNSVLAHHGMILSDQQLSVGGDKQYTKNFANIPHVDTMLADKAHSGHAVAVHDRNSFHKHIGFEGNLHNDDTINHRNRQMKLLNKSNTYMDSSNGPNFCCR